MSTLQLLPVFEYSKVQERYNSNHTHYDSSNRVIVEASAYSHMECDVVLPR